jgi:hypothetical protein
MSTPRTPDDGRNERQRAEQEKVERQRQADRDTRQRDIDEERDRSRKMRPGGTDRLDGATLREHASPRQRIAFEKDEPGFIERMAEEKQRPDFIERTLPEDPSDHFGQLTRDNVNPDIPSAPKPGEGQKGEAGGIVDPNSLGMDQSQQGAQPPPAEDQREQWPQAQKMPASGEYQKADDLQQQHEFDPNAPVPEPLRTASINEPPGSNIYPGADTGPNVLPGDGSALPPGTELPPLVLADISPDTATVGSPEDLVLTVTGTGFTPNCVVMVDDEDMATTFVDQTTLSASVPVAAEAGIVDVEVARGEDLSDVLTFEFVAPAGRRSAEKAERKPKKAEPRGKRQKKPKGKR